MARLYTMKRVHVWGKHIVLCCIVWVCLARGFAQEDSTGATLAIVRELAARNEALTSLIRMDYVIRHSSSDPEKRREKLEAMATKRRRPSGGTPLTHSRGVWAQDGVRQYLSEEAWQEEGQKYPGNVDVIDGEVWKSATRPDFMQGSIDRMENFGWRSIAPLRFGPRLLTAKYPLREVLEFEGASVHGQEEIEGRNTYVIDSQLPDSQYYARMWIDREAGLPLRVEYHDGPASSEDRKLVAELSNIQLHRLPNGGWIPIKGRHALHFPDETIFNYLEVDANSVTIERADIPDSLFVLEFPEGAKVYNAITGITTRGGAVVDRRLDSIVDEAIGAAHESDTTTTVRGHDLPVLANGPAASPDEDANGALRDTAKVFMDVSPAGAKPFSCLWIVLLASLAGFALTAMVLILRHPSRNASKGEVK